jgi:hypothetical protein
VASVVTAETVTAITVVIVALAIVVVATAVTEPPEKEVASNYVNAEESKVPSLTARKIEG